MRGNVGCMVRDLIVKYEYRMLSKKGGFSICIR